MSRSPWKNNHTFGRRNKTIVNHSADGRIRSIHRCCASFDRNRMRDVPDHESEILLQIVLNIDGDSGHPNQLEPALLRLYAVTPGETWGRCRTTNSANIQPSVAAYRNGSSGPT